MIKLCQYILCLYIWLPHFPRGHQHFYHLSDHTFKQFLQKSKDKVVTEKVTWIFHTFMTWHSNCKFEHMPKKNLRSALTTADGETITHDIKLTTHKEATNL